ncbi:MAG TPA: response regulator [Bryobacteraceae bacterium]|nr:response regulator [Bryobacteraceae bacterium]
MTDGESEEVSLLLVEDSPADVYLVEEAMRFEGLPFRIEVVEDGESAIRRIDSIDEQREGRVPTVMLLDMNVPRRTGLEVLARLRQSQRCRNIPVVMISSSDLQTERQRALELGAADYFRKPSTLDEFMELGKVVRRLHERCRAAS